MGFQGKSKLVDGSGHGILTNLTLLYDFGIIISEKPSNRFRPPTEKSPCGGLPGQAPG